VLDEIKEFAPIRGDNFYKHTDQSPTTGFPLFTIEIYPKQDSIDNKNLGNLMRLPLGRNQKSPDPTFFVDLSAPIEELRPHRNPVEVLTAGYSPWQVSDA
jgi:hypothetical protein